MLKRFLSNFIARLNTLPRRIKRLALLLLDSVTVVFAFLLAFYIRDEFRPWSSEKLYITLAVSTLFTLLVWIRLGLYRSLTRYADIRVLHKVFWGAFTGSLTVIAVAYFIGTSMPRSVPFIFFASMLFFVGGGRLFLRSTLNSAIAVKKENVIIFGAGACGYQLALSLESGSEYQPVAFIDENKDLEKTRILNIQVHGVQDIETLLAEYNVTKFLIAIPSATASQRQRICDLIDQFSVEVLLIPGSADLVSGKIQIDSFRKVDVVDLLGRDPVAPSESLFKQCVEKKNVLVTGAGGSIGSEISRQVITQCPCRLVLLDVSEFSLYSIDKELQQLVETNGTSIELIPVLGSVLEESLLAQTISTFDIQTIYHAAAYKHVPLVEQNVVMGIRNNVWGTKVCATVAQQKGVENFVLISSDKAVRPTNVMGASKRLSELVLQALSENQHSRTRFTMVRFGNVLGSSGSVIPLFKKQIAKGGPVTVTHEDITRYFMTIPEAAQLVIQAGSMGNGGEVYVLDMGKPIKIKSLAEKLIHLSGFSVKDQQHPYGDIEIKYTGLRPGEKLYEELLIGDNVEGTQHPSIMKAREIHISQQELNQLLQKLDEAMSNDDIEKVTQLLKEAPLSYGPSSAITDSFWLKSKPIDIVAKPKIGVVN